MTALIHNPGAFVVYVVVSSITPGPNNLMLTTVGITKGHLAAVKTAAGVSIGWGFQIAVCAFGLVAAVRAAPVIGTVIEGFSIAYLLRLAWKLWHTDHLGSAAPALGFRAAVLFQWINPKALTMSLSTAGLFVVRSGGGVHVWSALTVALAAMVLSYPCVCLWGVSGAAMTKTLARPGAARYFDRASALALVALVAWLILA
jgi:threonine/homoserine/homoserine lactone efflux protein